MSAIEIFDYAGQEVRTTVIDGSVWFVAADVCRILMHSNTSVAMDMLDTDDKRVVDGSKTDIPNLNPVNPNLWVVTESGVYELAFRSTAAGARSFKRWITHEVLPAIRQTGRFEVEQQFAIPQTYAEALQLAADQAAEIERQKEQLAVAGPKAESWDVLAEASGDFSVREAAQILDRDPAISTGQNRLFTTLAEVGWLDRRGRPYQRHVDRGRISSRPQSYLHPHTGETVLAKPQIRLTVKGIHELHKHLGGSQPLMFPVDGAA